MTTSGVVSFSVNQQQIITDAMMNCGALGVGETITDDDYQLCSRRLNMLVKQWQGRQDFSPGLKMWSRKNGNLFLSATTGTYSLGPNGTGWATNFTQQSTTVAAANGATSVTLASAAGISSGDNIGVVLDSLALNWTTVNGAPAGNVVTLTTGLAGTAASGNVVYTYPVASQARRPLAIVTAVLRDQNNNDVPIYTMTLQDYQALPTKTQVLAPTDPTSYYYQADLVNGTLKTDAPAAADCNKRIHFVYLSPPEDFVASTDTPDYPQEWYLALVDGLAVNIAPAFSLPVTQDMKDSFASSLAIAQQSNAETTTLYFQKDQNDFTSWGNF